MKQLEDIYTPKQIRNLLIQGAIGAIILLTAIGFTVRRCYGIRNDPGETIGIVSEIFWPSIKSQFRYIYYVGYVEYVGESSFYNADIAPGDTVYVLYEKGDPDNATLKRKKLEGKLGGSNGDPIYSKYIPYDK